MKFRVNLDTANIIRLEIVEDSSSGGFFLFTYEKDTTWDDWFESLDSAFEVAEERHGVSKSQWVESEK